VLLAHLARKRTKQSSNALAGNCAAVLVVKAANTTP